jgi:serine/threonine protein kinase
MRFNRQRRSVELSQEPEGNWLRIDQEDCFLETMDVADARHRGTNSSIFRCVGAEGDHPYVVKFCRYSVGTRSQWERRRISRFLREIDALKVARDSQFSDCVIRIVDDGVLEIPAIPQGPRTIGGTDQVRYYVMERADSDLTTFLEQNELTFPQKIALCSELVRILTGLHSLGIYHRDVKADNILMMSGQLLFGDLGLINFRNVDHDIDEAREKIGPFGLLSPEATNKCLGLRDKASFLFDCWIDEKSDVFQLGQMFWLILQDEVPTGHLSQADVRFPHIGVLSDVVHPMLQYGKVRRASLAEVRLALEPVLRETALT